MDIFKVKKQNIVLETLGDFWDRNYTKIRIMYRDFTIGIKNLIIWFPIIFADRNWDQAYLYRILTKKFELMEDLHKNHGHLMKSDKTAKQLMIVKNLTKRLADNNYLSNALVDYHKKYGEDFKFKSEPCKDMAGFFTLTDNRSVNDREDFRKCCNHSDKMEQQDIDMLTKMMNKYIGSWWD